MAEKTLAEIIRGMHRIDTLKDMNTKKFGDKLTLTFRRKMKLLNAAFEHLDPIHLENPIYSNFKTKLEGISSFYEETKNVLISADKLQSAIDEFKTSISEQTIQIQEES